MPPLAKSGQNWNNVLSYIKLNLGCPLNLIEMSDDEIIENLKSHTLQTFSQYCPLKKWLYIGPEHLFLNQDCGSSGSFHVKMTIFRI